MRTLAEVADRLRSTKGPWVSVLPSEKWAPLRNMLSGDPDFRIVEVEGRDSKTESSLFTEFGTHLSFPEYFGRNWDAFEECVRDLEWMPAHGYLLAVANADELLSQDRTEYDVFIDVMQTAGAEWATHRASGIPFHVILLVPGDRHESRPWNVPEILSASA